MGLRLPGGFVKLVRHPVPVQVNAIGDAVSIQVDLRSLQLRGVPVPILPAQADEGGRQLDEEQ